MCAICATRLEPVGPICDRELESRCGIRPGRGLVCGGSMSTQVEAPPEVRPGQLEFTLQELLSSHAYEEPLIAGGVRCHGGFIAGRYVSPRTLVRDPAIRSWQQ